MKQNEAVRIAIEQLGGYATLNQLNHKVLKIEGAVWKTKTPFASILRIVQTNPKYIYKIKPGLYGLLSHKKLNESKGIIQETEKNKNAKEVIDFSHYYYQGQLVEIGNLKKLHTFVPNQDKNKLFLETPLGSIRTLQEQPEYSYEHFVKRSSTIDVPWFNNRNMPHSFFEVEHSTDIQNSLLKFNDLQNFYTRMVIVADEARKAEFDAKMKYVSFDHLAGKARVEF